MWRPVRCGRCGGRWAGRGVPCRRCAAGRGLWPQGQHSAWQPERPACDRRGNAARGNLSGRGVIQPRLSQVGFSSGALVAGWVCSTTAFARGLLPSCVALGFVQVPRLSRVGFSLPALHSGLFNHGFRAWASAQGHWWRVGFVQPGFRTWASPFLRCTRVCSTTAVARGLLPSCIALRVCSTTAFARGLLPSGNDLRRTPGLFNHGFRAWASPLWQRLNLPCSCRGSRSRLFAPGRFVRPQPMVAGFSLPRASGFTCITCAHSLGG